MFVFRIEHKVENTGPYVSNVIGGYADTHRPMPYDDGMSDVDQHEHQFGFDSMKALQSWFNKPSEHAALKRNGFTIRIFNVADSRVIKGNKQLAFKRGKRKPVGEICLSTLAAGVF